MGTQYCHVLVEALMGLVGRVSGKGKAEPPLAGPSEDALHVPSWR